MPDRVHLARLCAPAALACVLFLALPARASDSTAPLYLAMGDSLATSVQPLPDGSHRRTKQGYAEYVWRDQSRRYAGVRLLKLGRGGSTSREVVRKRDKTGLTQLEQAVREIRTHRIALITIDIGAAEVEGCLSGTTFATGCTSAGYREVRKYVPAIVRRLRDAAGGRYIPIVGIDYYNYFLARWLRGNTGRTIARRSVRVEHRLTRELVRAYGSVGVPVADVEGAFDSLELRRYVYRRRWGRVPLAVARVCDWTWSCQIRTDDHANRAGYRVIGRQVLRALSGLAPPSGAAPDASGGVPAPK
jgi:lysophospholipase L1-like esterase